MAENNRVIITKTPREWKVIDKRIKELSSNSSHIKNKSEKDLSMDRYNRYLNNKISLLINDYEKCPECIKGLFPEKNPKRQKAISDVWHLKLTQISEYLNVPISTLIDRCIITPLLIEK